MAANSIMNASTDDAFHLLESIFTLPPENAISKEIIFYQLPAFHDVPMSPYKLVIWVPFDAF